MTAEYRVSLTGRRFLVTGASGGIGTQVVRMLGAAGAEVIGVDRPGTASPDATSFIECDLGDRREISELSSRLRGEFESLEGLVHTCGITRDGRLWKIPDEDWQEVLRVNLDSAFFLLKDLTPLLRSAEGASVVLVSSINGERGKIGQANYCASKAGLTALGRTAARELGGFGVRVNIVAPGLIETPMTASLPDEIRQRAVEETALGRAGEPADVASVVLFLCSEMSRHVTGQVLRVDGGQLIG